MNGIFDHICYVLEVSSVFKQMRTKPIYKKDTTPFLLILNVPRTSSYLIIYSHAFVCKLSLARSIIVRIITYYSYTIKYYISYLPWHYIICVDRVLTRKRRQNTSLHWITKALFCFVDMMAIIHRVLCTCDDDDYYFQSVWSE